MDFKRKPSERITRDKTIEIAKEHKGIELSGEDWRYCTASEAVLFLLDRLKYECDNLLKTNDKETRANALADMTELIFSITAHHGFPVEMIADFAAAKREDLGSFDKNLIVDMEKLK